MFVCYAKSNPEEEAKENFIATVLRKLESDNLNLQELLSNAGVGDEVYDTITETVEKKNKLIVVLMTALYDSDTDKAKELVKRLIAM